MENTEIEIQVNIEDGKALSAFLEKNAVFKKEDRQIDEYFSSAYSDFTEPRPIREWLRLRDAEGKYSITYKNWYFDADGKSSHCDEYETGLEDLAQMKNILKVLDFKSVVRVDKVRKSWTYEDYEIDIDSVTGLGDFVEIEYIGDKDVDPKKTTGEMVAFLKEIGVGKIRRNYVGYPFQLLFPTETKYEEV